jgi:DNA-binding HxlR family transcriptional regulator
LKVVWWKRAIPILINLKTTKRFWELEKIIIDISEKMLIQNLHLLEDAKFIKRKSFCEKTLHVEYSLLKRGKKFLKIMPTLIEIGNDL